MLALGCIVGEIFQKQQKGALQDMETDANGDVKSEEICKQAVIAIGEMCFSNECVSDT